MSDNCLVLAKVDDNHKNIAIAGLASILGIPDKVANQVVEGAPIILFDGLNPKQAEAVRHAFITLTEKGVGVDVKVTADCSERKITWPQEVKVRGRSLEDYAFAALENGFLVAGFTSPSTGEHFSVLCNPADSEAAQQGDTMSVVSGIAQAIESLAIQVSNLEAKVDALMAGGAAVAVSPNAEIEAMETIESPISLEEDNVDNVETVAADDTAEVEDVEELGEVAVEEVEEIDYEAAEDTTMADPPVVIEEDIEEVELEIAETGEIEEVEEEDEVVEVEEEVEIEEVEDLDADETPIAIDEEEEVVVEEVEDLGDDDIQIEEVSDMDEAETVEMADDDDDIVVEAVEEADDIEEVEEIDDVVLEDDDIVIEEVSEADDAIEMVEEVEADDETIALGETVESAVLVEDDFDTVEDVEEAEVVEDVATPEENLEVALGETAESPAVASEDNAQAASDFTGTETVVGEGGEFSVRLKGIRGKESKEKASAAIQEIMGFDAGKADKILKKVMITVIKDVSEPQANDIVAQFEDRGIKASAVAKK